MRFTFVILLFCGLGVDAQMIIKAHANYRPYAVGITPPLDIYTGAAAAYSLRKLRTAYTGSAIRVRRSNDNTEQDIGFTSSGDLDTASLKTFVGANSGFVTTWYDQSGNARNATQSTAANQPRIVGLSGIDRLNGEPSVFFIGAGNNNYLTHSVIATSPTRLYIFSSLSSETQATVWWGHRSEVTRLIQFQHAAASNSVVLNLRSSANVLQTVSIGTFTASLESNFLASARFDVANNTHISYLNGTASATNTTNFSGQTFNSTINSIGATNATGASFSSFMRGKMHELIIYTSDQSSNRTGIETNINSYYGIY
jgi:hypothetical protein